MSVDWTKVPPSIAAGYVASERERELKYVETTVCICKRCGDVCARHDVGVLVQGLGTIVSVRFATADERCPCCAEFNRPSPYGRGQSSPDAAQSATFDWCSRVLRFQDRLAAARQEETDETISDMKKKFKAMKREVDALAALVHSATARC